MYVKPSIGFKEFSKLDHDFKVIKTLYSLKQASRVWNDGLSNFHLDNNFKRTVNTTLFRKSTIITL